jgi:hypothetical protein
MVQESLLESFINLRDSQSKVLTKMEVKTLEMKSSTLMLLKKLISL